MSDTDMRGRQLKVVDNSVYTMAYRILTFDSFHSYNFTFCLSYGGSG